MIEDLAGDEAGPEPVQSAASSSTPAATVTASHGASKGLAIAALVVGALGLLTALVAVVFTRRRTV